MKQQFINLNKEGVNFLFEHDLLSKKYSTWCDEFSIEFETIQKMLDEDFNEETCQFSTFLNTLIQTALNKIQFNSELGIIYIDVGNMDKWEAEKALFNTFEKYKHSLKLST